jgi:hypothetical protein
MRSTLIVIGILLIAIALRTARQSCIRKLGAVAFLVASYMACYFITGAWWGGMLGVAAWFFLPWVELLTRVKRLRLPMDNRLRHRPAPNAAFFPNAQETVDTMERESFTHAADCAWEWSGMKQHYRIFMHADGKTVATLCLCEQADVVFSFVAITSMGDDGEILRTTNYPFAPTLKSPQKFHWNHVPCTRNCFRQILTNHREHIAKVGKSDADLSAMDADHLEEMIEEEMQEMIEHNLDHGIIEFAGDGYFCYSTKGLFYLWGQFLKDMVRLC